ncbi:lysozyme inhibitor LprI family protein [Roseomonas sp. ACRSG]|nr:lysozyme inhibitor LprI family protein [Roseomonas sp. ACRSG]
MRVLGLLAALMLTLAWPAAARECGPDATQADLGDCAGEGLRKADAALNETYGRIMDRLKPDPEAARALREAQRAWIRFRDGECDFATISAEGGSIRPMLVAQCRQHLTEQRVTQLRRYLSCQEGDPACPVPGAG